MAERTYADLGRRLGYLNLEAEDLELLSELRPLLVSNADELVKAFYRHLLGFEPTRRLLRDPAVKDRLLAKQAEYLVSLGDPVIDDGYAESRRRIGDVHEKLGLEPRWYLGAYALYFSLLTPIVCHANEADTERGARMLTALQKRLILDADLAMQAYVARREHDLEYMAGELADQQRLLSREFDEQGATLRRTAQRAKVAEELASIATLVAGLAHEIGTPMGVILGHAKLLEPVVGDGDGQWRLRTIQEQITRISRIIQTLLDLANPRPSRRLPVALEPLLENTLDFLEEKLKRHETRVERNFLPTPSISGDPERLQQLFLNLFLNAIDATTQGGRLRVSLGPCENDQVDVQIRVSDDGPGIDPENLERVFDPFFTTKPAGEGNGLGLMVCKGIVGDHGGTISVNSVVGEGTEFEVLLPLPRRSTAPPSDEADPREGATSA